MLGASTQAPSRSSWPLASNVEDKEPCRRTMSEPEQDETPLRHRSHKVYVYRLTHKVTERHLEEIFGFYGEISRLRLFAAVHKQPHAVIEYETEAGADLAIIHMDEGQIDGSCVRVTLTEEPEWCVLPPRPSQRRQGRRAIDHGWGRRADVRRPPLRRSRSASPS